MHTQTVFERYVFSHYGQAYVPLDSTTSFAGNHHRGQLNGLLGAAEPGLLFLTFGLHTGDVSIAVRVASAEPALEESWEEIVEASFTVPANSTLGLTDWNGRFWEPIPLPSGPYRVRYCALNFGVAEEAQVTNDEWGNPIERYELLFWPSELKPDMIIKVTRPRAAYWHSVAQRMESDSHAPTET